MRYQADRNQRTLVKHWRDHGGSAAMTSGVGGGFPDVVLGKEGITILAEVKNPAGRGTKLRKSQASFAFDWKGGPIVKIATVFEMDEILARPLVTGVRQAVSEAAWAIAEDDMMQFGTRDERHAAAIRVLDELAGQILRVSL